MRALVGWSQVYLPLATLASERGSAIADLAARVLAFAAQDGRLRLRAAFGHGLDAVTFEGGDLIAGQASRRNPNDAFFAALLQYSSPEAEPTIAVANMGGAQGVAGSYFSQFKQRIYRFSAQRRPGGECGAL